MPLRSSQNNAPAQSTSSTSSLAVNVSANQSPPLIAPPLLSSSASPAQPTGKGSLAAPDQLSHTGPKPPAQPAKGPLPPANPPVVQQPAAGTRVILVYFLWNLCLLIRIAFGSKRSRSLLSWYRVNHTCPLGSFCTAFGSRKCFIFFYYYFFYF